MSDTTPKQLLESPLSETNIANRIVLKYGHLFKVEKQKLIKNNVYYFNGHRWELNEGFPRDLLTYWMRDVISEIVLEENVLDHFQPTVHPTSGIVIRTPEEKVEGRVKHFDTFKAKDQVAEVLGLNRSLQAKKTDFETEEDAHILALKNAIINLKTGKALPPSPEYKITNNLDIPLKREEKCPLWLNYLNTAMEGNQEMIDYLQEVCGYALTGYNNQQALFMVYGPPGTGKTTFLNVLIKIMKPYWFEMPKRIVLEISTKKAQRQEELMTFRRAVHKRLATVQEVEGDEVWNATLLKAITGRDPLIAKDVRQEAFEFFPRFTIFVRANELPQVRSVGVGTWQRLHLLPFNKVFRHTGQEVIGLEREIYNLESKGVLNWMMEGAKRFLDRGHLVEPEFCKKLREEEEAKSKT